MAAMEARSPADALRARRLARMKALASALLALMVAVFVGASLATRQWPAFAPALAYVRAFAEAGAVGACADWFAVTALFRRPFGLPIPHTAILPRNKARIGEALGVFIADNFLTEAVLDARLKQLELARWGGDWLADPANARRLAERIARAAPDMLAALPRAALRDLAGAGAISALRALPAAPLAARVLRAVWTDRAGQAALEAALARIADLLDERQADIREGLAERAHTWLPRWVDRMLAGQVAQGAARLARDMQDPAHPWRAELERWVERQIARLANDTELRARGEALKLRLLADPRLKAASEELWAEVEQALASVAHAERRQLAGRLRPALQTLGGWLAEDAAAQARLNTWSRLIVRGLIAPRRADIGGFVAQVVASWDTRAVAGRLELQVGRDLQFIRINGALVGGLVGLVIFAVARAAHLG